MRNLWLVAIFIDGSVFGEGMYETAAEAALVSLKTVRHQQARTRKLLDGIEAVL